MGRSIGLRISRRSRIPASDGGHEEEFTNNGLEPPPGEWTGLFYHAYRLFCQQPVVAAAELAYYMEQERQQSFDPPAIVELRPPPPPLPHPPATTATAPAAVSFGDVLQSAFADEAAPIAKAPPPAELPTPEMAAALYEATAPAAKRRARANRFTREPSATPASTASEWLSMPIENADKVLPVSMYESEIEGPCMRCSGGYNCPWYEIGGPCRGCSGGRPVHNRARSTRLEAIPVKA